MWKEAVFKVVFSCAVGLELQFVGGPSYFLLMRDIIVRINGHNIVGYFIKHRDSGSHMSLFESPNSGCLSCRIRCLCYGINEIQSVLLSSVLLPINLCSFWYVVTIP